MGVSTKDGIANRSCFRELFCLDLKAMLELERTKMVDMNENLKRERQSLLHRVTQTESEREMAAEQLEEERAKARQLRSNCEMLMVRNSRRVPTSGSVETRDHTAT